MLDPVPPHPATKRRSLAYRLLRGAVIFYVTFLILLLLMEEQLIYQPSGPSAFAEKPTGVSVDDVSLMSADGTTLHAWWVVPSGWTPTRGAVLFCHGNGGNLSHRGWAAKALAETLNQAVLLFDYPGFGKSAGSVSEAGCHAAGAAAYDWIVQTGGVPGERVVLFGGSLGGGIAVPLAAERPHRALVLVSAFTSMPDMAQKVFPFLPSRWLIRTQFNNLARLADCRGPVFIAHGIDDALIPFAQGQRLFEAAPEPKQFVAMENYRHLDFPNEAALRELKRFLEATPGR